MAAAGPSTTAAPAGVPVESRSTELVSSLAVLASSSLQDHITDYADAHRWIDSFFDKIDRKAAPGPGASRPAFTELMKTPGRKRTAGGNAAAHPLSTAKKDPLATLLFPSAPSPRSPAHAADKENAGASPAPTSRGASPRKLLSPLGASAPRMAVLSPIRQNSPHTVVSAPSPKKQAVASPRPAKTAAPAVKAQDFAPQPVLAGVDEEDERAEVPVHDLSNVVEEDEEEEEEAEDPAPAAEAEREASVVLVDDDDKVNLSIIGEEEEDEDDSITSAVTAPSAQPSVVADAPVVPETQFTQSIPFSPSSLAAPPPILPASPQPQPQLRTVSGASSVAPEADAEEMSVPLNDAPSALRSAPSDALSSSLSSSTVRTPGTSSSRFATGSYSAAKLGTTGAALGSSPPPTAPSTVGPAIASARVSTGGSGPRQINFVGLSKKKSLGLGLGLGRGWATSMGSSTNDSQSSVPSSGVSQATSTQETTAPSSNGLSTHNSLHEAAQSGATTATGATKRKSLTGPDSASKAPKLSQAPQTAQEQEAEEARKRREALANRIHSMQARQSHLGGRTSNVAGPFGSGSSLFGQTKPLGAPATSLFHPTSTAPANKPVLATSSVLPPSNTTVNLATVASEGTGSGMRRPSVMERVKSFEQSTTGQEHAHPPSPSKIPSAFSSQFSPRAMSPPPAMSPRRVASPTPASPRPLTRSVTSGLPLATFGSPKLPQSISFGSPKIGAPASRSPPSAGTVPASIAALLSPPTVKPAIAAAAAASPARSPARPAIARSTTPDGTPPSAAAVAPAAQVEKPAASPVDLTLSDLEDDLLDDEHDEDEVPSIRAVNASTPAEAVVAAAAEAKAKAQAEAEAKQRAEATRVARIEAERAAAAERAARELEEQEAEREREALLQKRLPSLPEAKAPDDSDEDDEDDDDEMVEAALRGTKDDHAPAVVVSTATKEDFGAKASPSKIVMPGSFGSSLAAKAKEAAIAEASEGEDELEQDEDEDGDDEDDEEDRTTMSMMSSATATRTLNLSHQPFKPVTKTARLSKQGSKTSLASSVSSTSAFGLNRSVGKGAPPSGLKKPDTQVKSIQRAAAAAKKEKDEADRKAALREQKRAALEKKKQDDDRKLKVEVLEKKRKEREEAATKAKSGVVRGVKPKVADDEPAKKRKIEAEAKVRPEIKKVGAPTRPMPASASSHNVASLASSQGRPGAMGPPSSALNKSIGPPSALNKSAGAANPLSKSAGASSMIGQSFMSNKIRLPESSMSAHAQPGPPRPLAPTVPKAFSSQGMARPPQQAAPAPKPEPVYQELPEIDSEYSDSDDETQERKRAALPHWAQSPALAQALLNQQQVNPDEIFGPIPKLAIGEFFRNSSSAARLRARTSSAQWDGTDALSQTDMARYHRAMGYRSGLHLATNAPDDQQPPQNHPHAPQR
ncbi:hypothetical protein Rhopal_002146-T1 [Rhodotorula paludigena]|uniref:Inner centromere protein ARK-binding domain-containing protein n=1 Tax=Rhodotorula paludigena TaxID=86838 RepID=A0AAV5GIM7_9BASI|nr:hypothetical protein Rhopal_002146-T1 [Rhodotorula paludigena]